MSEWTEVSYAHLRETMLRTVKIPYGIDPILPGTANRAKPPSGLSNVRGDGTIRKEEWEAYQWNPPQWRTDEFPDVDPNASPKPTWEEMVVFHRKAILYWTSIDEHHVFREIDDERKRLTDKSALALEAGSIHVGDGLDHMTGLLQIVEQSGQAGESVPYIVMRDGNQKRKNIHTQAEVRAVLREVAKRENVVESAHNSIMEEYHRNAKIRDDESEDLDAREAAAAAALKIGENYGTYLADGIAAYNPDTLPDDLPTLKAVLIERLEAAAMAKTKAVMKAVSQQGVDRGFSCIDEERAVKKVARLCVLGVLAINRAEDDIWVKNAGAWARVAAASDLPDTEEHEGADPPDATLGADGEHYRQLTGIPEARQASTDAKARIDAVVVDNVPTFTVNGTAWTPGTPAQVAGRAATVQCHQPVGFNPVDDQDTETDERDISFSGTGTAVDDDGNEPEHAVRVRRPQSGEYFREAYVTIPAAQTDPVTVTLLAMNICGPATIQVRFTPPTP